MKPCIPPEIQRAAEEAERRREEAAAKLLLELRGAAGEGDPFDAGMRALIDADKNVVSLLKRKNG